MISVTQRLQANLHTESIENQRWQHFAAASDGVLLVRNDILVSRHNGEKSPLLAIMSTAVYRSSNAFPII